MKAKQGLSLLILLLLAALCVGGCRFATQTPYIDFTQPGENPALYNKNDAAPKPLLIALATVLSPHETIGYYRQIANNVSQKTGRPAILIQRKTYAEVNMLLANGDVDIAFMSTGAYSSYRGMHEVDLLVMAEYGGSTLYNAEVIVAKDSNIHSIDELQGKVFAFTDPLSYSGHMVIEDYLRKNNTVPENFFKRFFYTYGHDKSLWAVANKLADGASFDSQIFEYAKLKTPDLVEKVRVIATIGPAPTGPVVVRKDFSDTQKEELRRIFLEMHNEPEAATAMQKLVINRFVLPTPALYEPLRKLYDRTSLTL